MPAPPTIRHAMPSDVEAIQQVARTAWHAAYDDVLGPETVDETVDQWYGPSRVVTDDVESDERVLLVADIDDVIVGFGEGVPDDDEASLAHLYRLYVDPDHWRAGIGESLLDRLEVILRDRGFERLRLSVMADNGGAVAFYESNGFRRDGSEFNESLEIAEWHYEKPL